MEKRGNLLKFGERVIKNISLSKSQLYGFGFWENWHIKFPLEKLSIKDYQGEIMKPEVRITQLAERINLKDIMVLELGCLEGAHSLMLRDLGVKKIVAIEGRKDNFLKCLVIKNAFKLSNCKFLFGDINKILDSSLGHFELCLALGILYHLKDPISVIYRISELTDKLFAWTRCASKVHPEHFIEEIKYSDNHKYCGEYMYEDNTNITSGLEKRSFWLCEDDLYNLVRDAGFDNIEVIQKEDDKRGPVITFLAQKGKSL